MRGEASTRVFFQVMLIGDSCVGKTCLLVRFKDNTFLHNNFIATVGMDYRVRCLSAPILIRQIPADTYSLYRFRTKWSTWTAQKSKCK